MLNNITPNLYVNFNFYYNIKKNEVKTTVIIANIDYDIVSS